LKRGKAHPVLSDGVEETTDTDNVMQTQQTEAA
jgi:hypothetical protein